MFDMFAGGGYYVGGMHGIWWIFWLVVIGLGLYFGWARFGSGSRPRGERGESPLEILQRRLASGEITTQEYEASKALIERDAGRKG